MKPCRTLSPNGVGGVLDSPANTTVTLVKNVVNVDLPSGTSTFVPPVCHEPVEDLVPRHGLFLEIIFRI